MELKSLIKEYPLYMPDQFLSSQNLNDSFNYLEEQNRISRYGVVGQGIIDELTFLYSKTGSNASTITIKAGCGSTSDGFFLYIPETAGNSINVDYKNVRDITIKTKLNNLGATEKTIVCKQLLTADEAASEEYKKDAKPLSIDEVDLKTNYVLALYADFKEEQMANCLPGTCDTKGKSKKVRTIPLLINRTNFTAINLILQDISFLQIGGAISITAASSTADYRNKLNALITNNLKLIQTKVLALNIASAALLPDEKTLATNGAKRLDDIIKNLNVTSNLNEYYLSFCNDLQLAVNEYINAYNIFIKKYYNTDNLNRYCRMLALGQFPYASTDVYRYWWTSPLSSRDRRASYFILADLFKRIFSLIQSFMETNTFVTFLSAKYGTTATGGRIKIIPDKGYLSKLGSRSIPYYYNTLDVTSDLIGNLWRSEELNHHNELIFNYYDDKSVGRTAYADPFGFNIVDYPFYRVEGYIGLDINAAYTALQNIISNKNIPIRLLRVNVDNQTWGGFKTDYYTLVEDYKLFYKELQSIDYGSDQQTFLAYTKTFKNIYENINETSYRDIEEVKTTLNNIKSYSTMFVSGTTSKIVMKKEPGADIMARAKPASVNKPLYGGTVAEKIKKVINDHKVMEWRDKIYKGIPVKTMGLEYTLSELQGSEYLGGVYRGGTFVLLYSGTQVIGDLSLPYFLEKKK